ncbi:anti-sigma factor antagonist (plasmid) [Rhodococcus ruber]|nr:anti-sigma factor antagonist [Rhodococcus ruber]
MAPVIETPPTHATDEDEPLMAVTVQYRDSLAVVAARGDIDLLTAPQLRTAIHEALADAPRAVVIDLSAVTFLASVGIAALLDAHAAAGAEVPFAVVARGAATARPLELLGLTELLRVHPDLDAAAIDLGTGLNPAAPPR